MVQTNSILDPEARPMKRRVSSSRDSTRCLASSVGLAAARRAIPTSWCGGSSSKSIAEPPSSFAFASPLSQLVLSGKLPSKSQPALESVQPSRNYVGLGFCFCSSSFDCRAHRCQRYGLHLRRNCESAVLGVYYLLRIQFGQALFEEPGLNWRVSRFSGQAGSRHLGA